MHQGGARALRQLPGPLPVHELLQPPSLLSGSLWGPGLRHHVLVHLFSCVSQRSHAWLWAQPRPRARGLGSEGRGQGVRLEGQGMGRAGAKGVVGQRCCCCALLRLVYRLHKGVGPHKITRDGLQQQLGWAGLTCRQELNVQKRVVERGINGSGHPPDAMLTCPHVHILEQGPHGGHSVGNEECSAVQSGVRVLHNGITGDGVSVGVEPRLRASPWYFQKRNSLRCSGIVWGLLLLHSFSLMLLGASMLPQYPAVISNL